ncbi:hypothetical protein GCM10007977_024850 [Dactylosporangium sucinum]|uniref:Uncharacterized protein n=2 Tax=Dactylosporangium sucinum TaxID=1424081 RepID=A0A917WQ98_9ACTN|nr:hypothetical protein GCM10007977_024850 [Dactylosporangium sucinum]
MDDDMTSSPARGGRRRQARRSRPSGRWGAGALVAVINGLLVGVGGVYAATSSVAVTVSAAGAAVMLAGLIVLVHR